MTTRPPAMLKSDDVLRLLRNAGAPMTTREVAAKFPVKHLLVQSRLSKLADYGVISREYFDFYENGQHRKMCRWEARH